VEFSAPNHPEDRPSCARNPEARTTVIAGYGIAIANALEYSGVDSRRIFHAVGIDESLSNDPLHRLPVTTISRLYQACVDVTGNPYFGLSVSRFLHLSNLHALGYGLMASSTLLDACNRLTRYMCLVSQTARMLVKESDGESQLIAELLADPCPQTQDAWAAFLYRLMRLLHGGDIALLRVELAHSQPSGGDAPYVEHFGAPVLFEQKALALVFPSELMRIPLPGACPELAQFNDNIATGYLAKLDRNDVVAGTRAKIVELLPSGQCTKNRVAEALYMSPATLQSRLTQRDTSFHDLLNEIRHDLACSYLCQPVLSVTEIAYMLGFTDLSNFTRAFKRWTGQSPSAFRQQLVGSRPGTPDMGLSS